MVISSPQMGSDIDDYTENMAFCRALAYWRDLEKRCISRHLMDTLCSTQTCTPSLAITEKDTPEAEVKTTELAEVPFHIKYHNNGQDVFRVWMYSSFFLMVLLILLIFGNNMYSLWTCTACVEPCQQECQKYMTGSFWVDQASQYFLDDEFLL